MAIRRRFVLALARIRWLRRTVRAIKRGRRRIFEQCGSDRYSHPAYDDLDRKLAAYLPERDGVFLEAGAFDGFWGSNTYWFERFRGWSGVLVEPIPQFAALARKERPRSRVFQCALVPSTFDRDRIVLRYGGTMTVVAGLEGAEEHADLGVSLQLERSEGFEFEVPA